MDGYVTLYVVPDFVVVCVVENLNRVCIVRKNEAEQEDTLS